MQQNGTGFYTEFRPLLVDEPRPKVKKIKTIEMLPLTFATVTSKPFSTLTNETKGCVGVRGTCPLIFARIAVAWSYFYCEEKQSVLLLTRTDNTDPSHLVLCLRSRRESKLTGVFMLRAHVA